MASKITQVFLDRFEGNLGVLVPRDQDGATFDLPRHLLPEGTPEGTALTLTLSVDDEATAAGKSDVANLMQQLLDRKA